MGRIVRTAPGWMAAATDRRIVLCDLRRNLAQRVDLSLAELTHLAILPDATAWRWSRSATGSAGPPPPADGSGRPSCPRPSRRSAIDPEGYTAVTTEDGLLRVYNPAGASAGEFRGPPSDPRS